MSSNSIILSIGSINLKSNHLIIIGILVLSFSISFFLRSMPADFAWELHEFDPFFNYRATEYLVNNGFEKYFQWNDDLSWYPVGRDVTGTSQIMLHITTAVIYFIFQNFVNLYDFTILFPIIVGSLTSTVIFAFVRKLFGTSSGLIASILFAVSIPILTRGQLGWFKSEPLGLFLGILASYLFLSALTTNNFKIKISKSFFSAMLMIIGLSSWGGNLFFLVPLGILILCLPLLKNNYKNQLLTVIPFTLSLTLFSFSIERIALGFISTIEGYPIILSTLVMIIIIGFKKMSFSDKKIKNILIIFLIISIIIVSFSVIILNDKFSSSFLPTHRYLNAIFPLLTTSDPLTDSVSEHQTLSIEVSYQFHSILMVFAGIGAWILIKNKNSTRNEMIVYSLTFGIFGAYIGSAFMRLEVFTSIGIIILSSFALKIFLEQKTSHILNSKIKNKLISYLLYSFIIGILMIPFFLPTNANVFTIASNVPPTISNGGTNYPIATNDWRESLEWIKNNTPENAIIASWWDYGYWIQTIGNRATLADNSTLIDHRIKTIAKIFFESPDDAWKSLTQMESDYFVLFISGENTGYVTSAGEPIFILGGGADESKKYWFTKIAEVDTSKYLESDYFSGTDYFWDSTFLGKITPFQLMGYVNLSTDEISDKFIPGWIPVYTKHNKFLNSDDPFELVYSSSSYESQIDDVMIGVFVYKINENYQPQSNNWISPVIEYSQ